MPTNQVFTANTSSIHIHAYILPFIKVEANLHIYDFTQKTKPDTARHRAYSGFSQIIHIFIVKISLEDSFPEMKNDRNVGPLLKLLEFLP